MTVWWNENWTGRFLARSNKHECKNWFVVGVIYACRRPIHSDNVGAGPHNRTSSKSCNIVMVNKRYAV